MTSGSQFFLLGPLEFRRDGELVTLPNGHPRTLLAILLLHAGEPLSRERLIDELWGERAPTTAASSLHVHLSRLRAVLGDLLHRSASGYVLQPGEVDLDVWQFDDLVRRAERDPRAAAELLREALALFRGQPLSDVGGEGSLANWRRLLEERRLQALIARVDADLTAGSTSALVPELELLTAGDPLDERLTARLMLALYRSGRQTEALAAFERLRAAIDDSHGLQPGIELRDLQVAILNHDPSLAAPVDRLASTERPSSKAPLPRRLAEALHRSLIGRGGELQRAHALWERTVAGSPTVLLVSGEPGIGKTRLVAEFAELVGTDGTVLFGECEEDLQLVYQPWSSALRRDIRGRTSADLEQILAGNGELKRLVPELTERVPGLAEPVRDDPEGQKARLFDAVATYLDRVASKSPVLLILEDLHWADQPTVALMRYLMRELEQTPVMIVGTFRASEAGDDLTQVLADVSRRSGDAPVTLGGLEVRDVGLLAQERLGVEELSEDFVGALHAHTDGNGFFLEEILRFLTFDEAPRATDIIGVPASVQAVISHGLHWLPDQAQAQLGVAAVLGRRFDLSLLSAATGTDPSDALDLLRAALERGTVIETAGEAGSFMFAHALVREVLLAELGATRRARLHLQVGAAIENLYRESFDMPHADIARHLLASGERAVARTAARHAEAAGVIAMERLGYEQAAEFFASAISALQLNPGEDDGAYGRLLVLRADAVVSLGQMTEAGALFSAALGEARRLGDGMLAAEAARGIGVGWGATPAVPHPELLEALTLAVRLLPPSQELRRIHMLGQLASERWDLPRPERDQATLKAVEAARDQNDSRVLAESIIARHLVFVGTPRNAERRVLLEELLQSSRQSGDREILLQGLLRYHSDLKEIGDRARAEDVLAELESEASAVGQRMLLFMASAARTGLATAVASVPEAQTRLDHTVAVFGTFDPAPIIHEAFNALLGSFLGLTRQRDLFLSIIDEQMAGDEAGNAKSAAWRGACLAQLADADRADEARAMLDLMAAEGYADDGDPLAPLILSFCAQGAYRLGAVEHSSPLIERLRPLRDLWAQVHFISMPWGPIPQFLGLVEALAGRAAEADRELQQAIAMSRDLGSARFEAEALGYRAELALANGDGKTARAHAQAAHSLIAGTGWEPILERVEHLLPHAAAR